MLFMSEIPSITVFRSDDSGNACNRKKNQEPSGKYKLSYKNRIKIEGYRQTGRETNTLQLKPFNTPLFLSGLKVVYKTHKQ